MKAVFLDRDGVINYHRTDYVKNSNEFQLVPQVEKWLKLLTENDYRLFVVTNQSVIGRNLVTTNTLELIHKKMQDFFKSHGFEITKIYYCPHLPIDGCACRKPKTKLFEDAIDDYDIITSESWLIGDSDTDIVAGKTIGCKTIKIKTNDTLEYAVKTILQEQ